MSENESETPEEEVTNTEGDNTQDGEETESDTNNGGESEPVNSAKTTRTVELYPAEQVAPGNMKINATLSKLVMPTDQDKQLEVLSKLSNTARNRALLSKLNPNTGIAICGFEFEDQADIEDTPDTSGEPYSEPPDENPEQTSIEDFVNSSNKDSEVEPPIDDEFAEYLQCETCEKAFPPEDVVTDGDGIHLCKTCEAEFSESEKPVAV